MFLNKEKKFKQTTISKNTDPSTQRYLSRNELIYSICGFFFGLACLLTGILLLFNGIYGKTSLMFKYAKVAVNIGDAPFGLVIAIVGGIIIGITKYKFTNK